MDDQIRQTVGHLQTLAIEQNKRSKEIERHVRDIKYAVVVIWAGLILLSYQILKT